MTGPDYRGWAGHPHGWRYLAEKINGSGISAGWYDNELPITGVQLTDALSGPGQLTGEISPVALRELGLDASPRIGEWSALVHAEIDGEIYGSYFLVASKFSGPKWTLDCPSMAIYPKGQPYPGDKSFTTVDPLDICRDVWLTLQTRPDSNIGMLIDGTTRTPVLVGGGGQPPSSTGSASSTDASSSAGTADAEPFVLNWWTTHDCGSVIDGLAQAAPFDYRERHRWSDSSHTSVSHFLDFAYPAFGARRTNLRFVYGENIQAVPDVDRDGNDWANHVVVLGAGTGSATIRAEAMVHDGRVRRTVTVTDSSIVLVADAQRAAQLELARRNQLLTISSVIVRDHPNAPLGSFQVGDEIRVMGVLDWMPVDMWCRVVARTISPEKPDVMALTLIRSDWANLPVVAA